MAIYRCKSCGGELDVTSNLTVVECDYCGIKQTIPTVQDENIQGLFNRANVLRMKGEFDKAEQIYEKILQANDKEAEAYWGVILCKYGIEYVDDPASFKRVPTCHRASFDSITADEDYKAALTYADAVQRSIYEAEAAAIEEIQKGILAISRNEKPYDVFICYKETDENGKRTIDSTIANDIYHQLTQEGMKVFYAAITLEDKLGREYEPYIFAALNSSKVMLVLGTKPQYFSAVWVKNEWSRFLKIMKADRSKMLIPCYRDMDAYELPEEFAHLQAQDMSKIGFINDVIRGIKKVVKPEETAQQKEVVTVAANANTEPLLKRAFMFLEDGEWKSADEYCEKVLDIDPENADAYLGKLMAELQVKKQEDLKTAEKSFEDHSYYQKIKRFGGEELQKELKEYIDFINERNENERLEGIYQQGKKLMETATEQAYTEAVSVFESITQYKDATTLAKECREKAENLKNAERLAEQRYREIVAEYEIFSKKVKSPSEEQEMKKEIDKRSKECDILKALLEAFPANSKELAETESEISEKRGKIEALQKERATLGLFAGKRKKEIDENVSVLQRDVDALETKRTQLKNALCGYSSVEAISKNINEIEKELPKLKLAVEESERGRSTLPDLEKEMVKYTFKSAKVGGYVPFGSYPQGKNANEKEKIEWLVLEKQGGKAFLLSKYGLDCQKYNEKYEAVTWENCTLRKWLNDTFINTAFTKEERGMIPTVTVSADKNPKYNTNPGNSTKDQVFLLSIPEAEKYFSSDEERVCKATAYAKGKAPLVRYNDGRWWWLRSPGLSTDCAAYVDDDGDVCAYGSSVDYDLTAVRPALWVELDSDIF